MAATYTLISSNVLTASAASVTFSSIPATFTDLVLRVSARADSGSFREPYLTLNNLTTSIYSFTRLYGTGSSVASSREAANTPSNMYPMFINGSTSTADTFGSLEIYIPSYTASQAKQISLFSVQENNTTAAYMEIAAQLVNTTAAINEITFTYANLVAGSSFYLYGISNA
jgi:hypothetical protein